MKEFFKRLYEEAYDLPNFYLEIENELYCHVFTSFFILALVLSFALGIRFFILDHKSRKKKKKTLINMEKNVLRVLEEKDKNKKERNI